MSNTKETQTKEQVDNSILEILAEVSGLKLDFIKDIQSKKKIGINLTPDQYIQAVRLAREKLESEIVTELKDEIQDLAEAITNLENQMDKYSL